MGKTRERRYSKRWFLRKRLLEIRRRFRSRFLTLAHVRNQGRRPWGPQFLKVRRRRNILGNITLFRDQLWCGAVRGGRGRAERGPSKQLRLLRARCLWSFARLQKAGLQMFAYFHNDRANSLTVCTRRPAAAAGGEEKNPPISYAILEIKAGDPSIS